MRLIYDGIKAISKNGKSAKYEFFHPRDLRRCFVWIPRSQVREISEHEINIPDWLWDEIKKKL